MLLCEGASVGAQLASQRGIGGKRLQAFREDGGVEGRHDEAGLAVLQPFAHAAHVEGDDGKAVRLRLRAGKAEGLLPARRKDQHVALPQEAFRIVHPARKLDYVLQAILRAEAFQHRLVASVPRDAGPPGALQLTQSLHQQIGSLAANELPKKRMRRGAPCGRAGASPDGTGTTG